MCEGRAISTLQRWEVHLADVPFKDNVGCSKGRPVIVLKDEGKMVRVLCATSQNKHGNDCYYCIRLAAPAGLTEKTYVDIYKTDQIPAAGFVKRLGKLLPVDIYNIQNSMRKYKDAQMFAEP